MTRPQPDEAVVRVDHSMLVDRREFLFCAAIAAIVGTPVDPAVEGGQEMYGLIGRMAAGPGQRDAMIEILIEGTSSMPGCLSYIVAKDTADADAIWITEVWDSKASHEASLTLPAVKAAIAKGRPLIASMGDATVTQPIGGHGLTRAPR